MKRTIHAVAVVTVTAAFALAASPSRAQMPSPTLAEQREAIAKLGGLIGEWEGEAWIRMGPGPQQPFHAEERVQEKLDGVALLVEGRGTSRDEAGREHVGHLALAVVTWDAAADRYGFATHTALGYHTDATLELLDDGKMRWGFTAPGREIRYTIDLTGDTWHEMGEVSMDSGATWMHFHDMTLRRVE